MTIMAFRSPASRFALGFVGLAAVAAAIAPPVLSQAPPQSQLFSLNVVSVKPDQLTAYINLQKSEIIPALQKGGQVFRDSWRTATFGETYTFYHVAPITGFDQYDNPGPMTKALGEDGSAALLAKLRPMIASQKIYAMRTRPDLSYTTEGAAAQKMAIVTVVQVNPTKVAEFEAFIKGEWIPALKKGGAKQYTVVQALYGGGASEFHTLVGIDKYADLAAHPVTKALGDDGVAKMMAKGGGFADSIERSVVRLDQDLSFQPKASSSK
jgi:hypothetical protein